MASIPVPRSYPQILSDAIDVFNSRYPTKGLKVGGPILSILEAASMSDARDTQDLFDFLAAIDIDKAEDSDLDNWGQSEGAVRLAATASRGTITIQDSSFQKIATKIYQGQPAPISGSTTVYVADASAFPSTGSIYLGRGTLNLEGPVAYTSPTLQAGGYWSLAISGGTHRYHNLAETVVLAQGGDRVVAAGTIVQTPQGNAVNAVSFATLQSATILDGEVSVQEVPIICQETGIIGNVPANVISSVPSPAFTGMTVINPNPLSNGLELEDDQSYRERIKKVRASKSRGTKLAITTGVLGITAPDEAARVQSAAIVKRKNQPTILYIDDGTGYEDKTAGSSIESLMDSATGGEQIFQLAHGRPVAKAYCQSSISAPFGLQSGCVLACKIGGVRSEHSFDASSFRDISKATAAEVVASINANPNLLFTAKTSSFGTTVSVMAKQDVNEDILLVSPSIGVDANTFLGFPTGRTDTLRLYRNDRLLYKDGLDAKLSTNPTTAWVGFAEGDTIKISVDGTTAVTYTITGQDFINAGTGYASVSESNGLAAWAAVINAKIPGITATVSSASSLELTSNLRANSRASITIDPSSTLVSKGMFSTLSAAGKSSDYVLDRNLGQIILTTPLSAGETLSAGSIYTRGYRQSGTLGTTTISAATGNLYFVVDGAASIVHTGLSASTYLKVTTASSSPIKRFAAYSDAGLATAALIFANLQVGDWVVAWDSAFASATPSTAAALKGIWRISNVDTAGQWFEIDSSPLAAPGAPGYYTISNFVAGGVSFVRSVAIPQVVTFAAGNYAASDVVATINAQLAGATATTFQTNIVRVTTNTYGTGDIAFISADLQGQQFGFTPGLSTNTDAHVPVVESINNEVGTPSFNFADVATVTVGGNTTFTLAQTIAAIGGNNNSVAGWLRPLPTPSYTARYGSNTGDHSPILSVTGTQILLRHLLNTPVVDTGAAPTNFTGGRLYLANPFDLGPRDTLNVVLDQDSVSKSFNINTYRKCLPDAAVPYSTSIRLLDADNANAVLTTAFGQTFNFGDFDVAMKARYISHKSDSSKSVLWRYSRHGADGNGAQIQYTYPQAPNLPVVLSTTEDTAVTVSIGLPSGARRSASILANEKVAFGRSNFNAYESSVTMVTGFRITTIVRAGSTVTVTLGMPNSDVTDHQYQNGDVLYLTSNSANFPSGWKTVTRVNATQVTYTEAGAAVTETYALLSSPLMMTWTTTPQVWSTVANGDVVWISSATSVNAGLQGFWQLTAAPVTLSVTFKMPLASVTMFNWAAVNTVDAIQFWPLTGNTVSAVVAAVNAKNSIIKGTVLGSGAGVLSRSTVDESNDGTGVEQSYVLTDGLNHVSSSSYDAGSGNLVLVLKNAVSSNLTAPNDWANEDIRLVPKTARNIAAFLNNGSITGLTLGGGGVQVSSKGGKIEISSLTAGSTGSVKVLGGTANAVTAPVKGSANLTATNSIMVVQAADSDIVGLSAGHWVSIDNAVKAQKTLDWTSSTALAVGANGKVTVSGAGSAWRYAGSMTTPVVGARWQIERHGNFTAYVASNEDQSAPLADFTAVKEGSWVSIPQATGAWKKEAALTQIRRNTATATTLQDGTVLVTGGNDAGGTAVNKVGIYNPTTNVWTDISGTDPMPGARFGHTASLLADGRVLVAGGYLGASTQATVWIYNPTAALGARWTTTTSLGTARAYHTATVLADNTVLVAGGESSAGVELNNCELYTPGAATWTPIGATMAVARSRHTATVLSSGQVLLANGFGGGLALATAEIYSTNNQTISQPASSGVIRYRHTATVLPNGKVLFAGGWDGATSITTVQLFDPTTATWSTASSLPETRSNHGAVLLGNGKVLVVGGTTGASTVLASCLQYDYAADAWSYTGAMTTGRTAPLLVLVGGKAMVLGGTLASGLDTTSTELFDTAAGVSALNTGYFRVVRVLFDTPNKKWAFWIENPNSVEELAPISYVSFLDKNSFLPGDTLSIGANVTGLGNQGLWTVASINPLNTQIMTLQGSPVTTASPVTLSTNVSFIQGISGSVSRLIKKVLWIAPQVNNAGYSDVAFTTNHSSELVSAVNGSILNSLGKMSFPSTLQDGIDGYRYNTGLIAEANRVVYGDESDPSTYPGIAAAGATINIQGPTIKRIQVALAIRIRSGSAADVISRVQSQVAGVVNNAGVGESIAISDIVSAAAAVDGVLSVTVLNPSYTAGKDLISVQPFEKPMALDLNSDVVVSLVGA